MIGCKNLDWLKVNYFLIVILSSVLIRWCISLYPYSGFGKPPMFGDFEGKFILIAPCLYLPSNHFVIHVVRTLAGYMYEKRECAILANGSTVIECNSYQTIQVPTLFLSF